MSTSDRDGQTPADDELEALFRAARDLPPEMPPGLSARIMSDAAMETRARDQVLAAAPAGDRAGLMAQFLALIGGWPAMAGLGTAALAGLWLGVSPPAILEEQAAFLGAGSVSEDLYLVDTVSAFDILASDG
ncbi:MAG: hypothetical protein ACU0DK_05865 [Pseudooceanicola sp.]